MLTAMRCPKCSNKLIQKSGTSTRLRLKGAVEFSDDGRCRAQCFWCSEPVDLPLALQKAADEEERFTIPERTVVRPKRVS